jgi:hypothetical protein
MLTGAIEDRIKNLIMEGHTKEVIEGKITREYGKVQGLAIWYDCCYNTICREQGINRKKGEELKIKKSRPNVKQGK